VLQIHTTLTRLASGGSIPASREYPLMAEGRPPFKRAVAVIPRLSAPTLSGARRAKMTDPKQLPFESFGPGHSISTRIGSLPWPTMRNIRLPIPICPITSDLEQLTHRGEPFASLPFHASRSPVPRPRCGPGREQGYAFRRNHSAPYRQVCLTHACQDGYAPIPRPAHAPVVRETPPHSSARARTMRVLVVTNTHSSRWLYNLAV